MDLIDFWFCFVFYILVIDLLEDEYRCKDVDIHIYYVYASIQH